MSSTRVRSYNGNSVVINVSSLVKFLLKLGVTLARLNTTRVQGSAIY
jgi:hypothetical protein